MSRELPQITQRSIPDAQVIATPQIVSVENNQVASAVSRLGQTLEGGAEVASNIGVQRDKFNYTIARSKFLQQSVDLQNQLENDPDYATIPQKYQEGIDKIKTDTLQNLGRNNLSGLLDQEMNLYKAKQFGTINKIAQDKQEAFAIVEADKTMEDNLNLAAKRSTNNLTRESLLFTSKELYANSIPENNPNKAILVRENDKKVDKRFAETYLEGHTPYEQLRLLRQEQEKPGSNFTQHLPADIRQDYYNRALDEVRRLEEKKIDTTRVDLALAGKIILDPTSNENQKAVDVVWSDRQQTLLNQGATQEQILNSSLDMVEKTGIMPTPIKSVINANILNGTTQQKAAFSRYIANAADLNPKILNTLDDQTKTKALAIAYNIRAGLSVDQAVTWVENDFNAASKRDNKYREQLWGKQNKDFIDDNTITSHLQDEPGFDFFTKNPDIPPKLVNEFNNLSKGYFVNEKTDINTANKLAEKTIRSRWGITEIGGKRYMKYAPETIYGNEDKWVYKQLESDYKSPIKDLNLEVDYSTINTRKPSYFVHKKNDFGGIDVILDDKNQPRKFTPDYKTAHQNKIETELAKAREERQNKITEEEIQKLVPLR